MSSPEEWFKTLPVVTKVYFVLAVGTTALVSFGMLDPFILYLDFKLVFERFQIWRLFTNFIFFGKFGMPWVFQMFILVRYFKMLEEQYFPGVRGTAEFITLCTFGASVMITIAYFWQGLLFLGPGLVFMCLYVWSRKDPMRQVSFWGFTFKAWHFPFVLMIFSVIIGSSPILDVVGILVGHMYHFLVDKVPREYGHTLLKTPVWVYRLFEEQTIRRPGAAWQRGGGHRLG